VDARRDLADRVLDSMDLEREKGITILAKQTAVVWQGVTINIVDTPGHADFGGEVERALAMVDGALLLVDAAEGPLPQTRFVLRKALERRLALVVVVNKMDRADARPAEVLRDVEDLVIDCGADEHQLEFPVLYAVGRDGWASPDPATPGSTLAPLLDTLLATVPPPEDRSDEPLAALVTNLDASPYLGRLALCRVVRGRIGRNQTIAWCRRDGAVEPARVTDLSVARGLERVSVESAAAGDLVAVAGLPEVTVGETLADPDAPQALGHLQVDEPSLSVTLGVNTSPLAGREGSKVTARLIQARLEAEQLGNVAIRIRPTDQAGTYEVQGRGELALAVLVELMRRDGFELTVGKPQVLTAVVDGVVSEPFERVDVDLPEEHLGTVTQILASRRGRCLEVVSQSSGWARAVWRVPARGLVGARRELVSQTHGTAVLHHAFDGLEPWAGEIRPRRTGSMVADRPGVTTAYALANLEARGTLFVGPGEEVYEGMVIGEHSRPDDLDVNPTKEKKLTNMRSSTADELVRLTPPSRLSLEAALEFMADDEQVEVTPSSVRLRKAELSQAARGRARGRARAISA
jgi:GTP-binding protein